MRLKNLLSFLDYMERAIITVGYLYGIYYFCSIEAPLPSKIFGAVLITLIFAVYVWQILKKSKSPSENFPSKPMPILSETALKLTVGISLLSFLILIIIVVYEVLVQQGSSYFPLKLISSVILYSIFKQSLRRIVSLRQSK